MQFDSTTPVYVSTSSENVKTPSQPCRLNTSLLFGNDNSNTPDHPASAAARRAHLRRERCARAERAPAPRTHGVPAATLHFRSYHPHTLDFFVQFAGHAAAALDVPLSQPWYVLRIVLFAVPAFFPFYDGLLSFFTI